MVSVSGNDKNNRVSVKPITINNQVEATNNLAKYYSEISKDWAIGEGLIQNIDYSSKTYALQSKESATEAKASLDEAKGYTSDAVEEIQNLEQVVLSNISMLGQSASSTVEQGISNIGETIAEGLDNINTSVTGGVETIETLQANSIAEVNQAKEQAIKDFNNASDKVNYLFVMPIGTIGFSPFPIDETKGLRRILNGQIIIQEQFTGFVKWLKDNIELYPQMACTEEEWQATVTMSTFGQCGKFVIDDEAGTIRLPKITGFVQGLTDLASLGELVEAGLPTLTTDSTGAHTHTRGTMDIKGTATAIEDSCGVARNTGVFTGAFYNSKTLGQAFSISSGGDGATLAFQASRNWTGATSTNGAHTHTIAGTADTVQPEAIRYPYFIQVATGVEETIDTTREIELNNPFFFGYYQYFETAPNNISWLKSEGQWNSKAVYTDYYDWILTNTNNGVENFKLSTDTYDDYAWVVNIADETFRLPIKTKNAPFTVNGTANVDVYGNGKSLGLTDGKLTASPVASQNYAAASVFQKSAYNTNVGTVISSPSDSNGLGSTNKSIGVTTDASKSGLTGKATISTSENTNVSLYFYVGETVQNANLINAGRIEEKLADIKAELPHKLKDNQITNCLLEVPQHIKYTLENGTLTLKAGSEVIVPNGFESDGTTPKFDYVTIESDLTIALGWTINGKTFLFYDVSENALYNQPPNWSNSNLWSGASPTIDKQYGIWYNTSNNIIQGTQDTGATWVGKYSLPLAIYSCGASKEILSIDQVFNGFGYIGSTIWVDKGVKGLIPNGRNEDGSFINKEITTNNLFMYTFNSVVYNGTIGIRGDLNGLTWYTTYQYDNLNNYNITSAGYWDAVPFATFSHDDNVITSFNPKQPFRAVDYSEYIDTIDGNWTYKLLELANATTLSNTANTTYSLDSYLPNDGRTYEVLFSFNGSATAASQYNIDTGFGTVYCFAPIKTNISGCVILPITTRRTIIIHPTSLTSGTNKYSFRVNGYRKVR